MSLRICQLFTIILMVSLMVACSPPHPSAKPAITQIRESMTPESKPSQTPTLTRFSTIDPLTTIAFAISAATSKAKYQTKVSENATQRAESLTPQFTPGVYFDYCKEWGELISDGKWALCTDFRDPVIFIDQSNQTWLFSYKSFYGQDIDPFFLCTELLHTTKDGVYVYFSLPEECMLTEPWFPSMIGLFRMNLTNGKVDRILGENYDFQNHSGLTYDVSISPTGRRMAYIANETPPLTLNILDLKTGENRSLQLESKYIYGGLFEWSEDGTKLALKLLSKPKDEYGDDLISFAFLDLLKTDPIVTFIQEKEFFWITAEMDVTELGVRVKVYDESPMFYDLKTGILSTITK
jgi:hypothetical protein